MSTVMEEQLETPRCASPIFKRMALIGAGLTGQAFGKVVVSQNLVETVVAFDKDPSLSITAVEEGAAHLTATELGEALTGADVVILATPITATKAMLNDVLDTAEVGSIVSDFGRTKSEIVAIAEAHPRVQSREVCFIGGDPLVTRRALLSYKDPSDVFETEACFLCKTSTTDPVLLGRLLELWQCVGVQVIIARPHRHDKLVSWTEQLQILATASCMLALEAAGEDQNLIRGVAGSILRDSTSHVKDINIEQFDDVLNANRQNLRDGLKALREVIARFETNLDDPHQLHEMLNDAALFRKHLDVFTIEKPAESCLDPTEET